MKNFLQKMRYKFSQFMIGRYGMDDLAKAENTLIWILLLFSLFLSRWTSVAIVLNLLFWVLLFHMYYRVFSRNINKRYAENEWYRNLRYKVVVKWQNWKKHMTDRKTYRFFKCPSCKQKVRVPKGHGKVKITCPKCREEFIRNSR